MSFLKNIFGKKETPIQSNEDFWKWFSNHAQAFHNIVKVHKRIEEDFFEKLTPKLNQLKEGYFYLTGMLNKNTAELILTADGVIQNLVFVEELVAAAPEIPGWKITAHKPEMDLTKLSINMYGYNFNKDNVSFYAEEVPSCPDEISLFITHDDLTTENGKEIISGIYIFLDNYLGELRSVTTIDDMTILPKSEAERDLIPIEKLKSYLIWREKEFSEKYEAITIDTSEHEYSLLEATLANGKPLIASLNMDLLKWDNKASHPWMLKFQKYWNKSVNNGMPDNKTLELLNTIEDDMLLELKDIQGHLYVGRETAEGVRTVYFACNEFRDCSKIAQRIVEQHKPNIDISYQIYKDKYWQSLKHFG